MKQVGLFFGSFNPIHIGHLALANYMLEFENIEEIWFVVSPQNPFKNADELLSAEQRLEMVCIATQKEPKYRAEDIELSLPIPSYTIDTLKALEKKYTDCCFSIIMGADNIARFEHWKSAEEIIANHRIYVYPRHGTNLHSHTLTHNCKITAAPLIEIASSDIRQWIKEGKQTPFFLPAKVFEYIQSKGLYLDDKN
ncbi:nicotinate-nucleotide adenylyltransferase [Carboxylicivirga sediminis]|uniref:Probable nicotinate-nucleotide adenylyltransferase n=1 Tax=Carboxylicivirga sediminis TaxID=2006564 RepID=A0A941F939_9BACT|nr:nicotinate (nicotinamide) nucleotide adenylyltransferase [Carboxylicivirga sediminis]MBR8537634.1 nicotinate-nucleotide adenylyltransferase [Carboxylicivirga sediminis]